MNRFCNRKGMAIVVVLVMSLAFMMLVGVLFFFTGAQRVSHSSIVRQTKAMLAAKAAVQVAAYKYRVLPREFYRYQDAVKTIAGTPNPNSALLPSDPSVVVGAWMGDLSSDQPGALASLAARLSQVDPDNGAFAMCVTKFDLISKSDIGYRQDFLRVEAWGDYEGERKTIEEFIEIQVTQ